MSSKTVNVQIEKLVIDGLGDINHHRVGAVIQKELVRLLGSQNLSGSLTQSAFIKAIDAKPIVKASNERRLGLRIANSVYRGINR